MLRFVLILLPLLCLFSAVPLPAQAEDGTRVDVLLDLDDDPATGCSVATADGSFDGVEQRVRLWVDRGQSQVWGVLLDDCVDPATDAFTYPSATDVLALPSSSVPVGVGLGVQGSTVVEAVLPTLALSSLVRAAVTTDTDALTTTDGTPGGGAIYFSSSPVAAPSSGGFGLTLLALLLLALGAFVIARRNPSVVRASTVFLLLLTASVAWAVIVADGQPGDWLGAPNATDATDPAPDLQAVFGEIEPDGSISLRVDLSYFDLCSGVSCDDGDPTTSDTCSGGLICVNDCVYPPNACGFVEGASAGEGSFFVPNGSGGCLEPPTLQIAINLEMGLPYDEDLELRQARLSSCDTLTRISDEVRAVFAGFTPVPFPLEYVDVPGIQPNAELSWNAITLNIEILVAIDPAALPAGVTEQTVVAKIRSEYENDVTLFDGLTAAIEDDLKFLSPTSGAPATAATFYISVDVY